MFSFVSPIFWTAIILPVLLWTLLSWYTYWSLVFACVLVQMVPRIQTLSLLDKSTGSDQFSTYFGRGKITKYYFRQLSFIYVFKNLLAFLFFLRIFRGKLLALAFPLVRGCSIRASEEIQKLWDLKYKIGKSVRSSVQQFSIFFCQQL